MGGKLELVGRAGKYLPNCYIIKDGSREFYLKDYQLHIYFSIKEIRKFKMREISKNN